MLSKAEVVATSRKFICVRPLTYEDKVEADYLRKVFNRGGALENTVFAILDPLGKKYLAEPGRSPDMSMPEADLGLTAFSKALVKLTADYKPTKEPTVLPTVKNLKYGLNVAACDRRPVAYVISKDGTLQTQLKELAWKEEFQGQFVYVNATDGDKVSSLIGVPAGAAIVFAQPDEYALTGQVLACYSRGGDLEAEMRKAISAFKPWTMDHIQHLRNAVQKGIRWKTVIPEEDRGAAAAVARLWGEGN